MVNNATTNLVIGIVSIVVNAVTIPLGLSLINRGQAALKEKAKKNNGGTEVEVAPDLAIINGEDFDARRSLYDKIKGMEGYGSDDFDEEAVVIATIDELKNKLNAIRGVKNEVPVKDEIVAEESVELPSEEQLMAELKD